MTTPYTARGIAGHASVALFPVEYPTNEQYAVKVRDVDSVHKTVCVSIGDDAVDVYGSVDQLRTLANRILAGIDETVKQRNIEAES